jgi:hypothetical protein
MAQLLGFQRMCGMGLHLDCSWLGEIPVGH